MNRRIQPIQKEEALWLSVLVFLAVLAFVGLLSVDDFEPTERQGTRVTFESAELTDGEFNTP